MLIGIFCTVAMLPATSLSMATRPAMRLRRSSAPRLSEVPAKAPASPSFSPLCLSALGDYADGKLSPVRLRTADGQWCYALANDSTAVRIASADLMKRTQVGFYFGLWYALSVIYSVKNKQAHIALALPNIIATAQLVVGAIIAAVVWATGLRTPPQVSGAAFRTLMPIGLMHGIGHLTGVCATLLGHVAHPRHRPW